MLTIWMTPKFCSLGYFCKLDFISLYFETPKQTASKQMRKIAFEKLFSPFPSMLSIPTSLKQISLFREELTYIIDSVINVKLERLRKKNKMIVEVLDGFFDFMIWFQFTFTENM